MILAIIQARMESRRLSGKSMALIEGVPLLEHVIKRTQAATFVERVVVATSDRPADDVLAAHVETLDVDVYRGNADDVLARFYWCSERYQAASVFVRICADDPFVDPALIDYALLAWADVQANPILPIGRPNYVQLGGITWPLGLGVEVFNGIALNDAHQYATDPFDREHVTPWMLRGPHVVIKDPDQRKTINTRWTIDEPADLEFARGVYAKLYASNPVFGYDDMIKAGY